MTVADGDCEGDSVWWFMGVARSDGGYSGW